MGDKSMDAGETAEEMTEPGAEQVIGRYMDMVYRLAFARMGSRSDVDDICQEVFLLYLQTDKKFESEEHRKAWLIRVTVNCAKKIQASVWSKVWNYGRN